VKKEGEEEDDDDDDDVCVREFRRAKKVRSMVNG
jgi:hypothetical protein